MILRLVCDRCGRSNNVRTRSATAGTSRWPWPPFHLPKGWRMLVQLSEDEPRLLGGEDDPRAFLCGMCSDVVDRLANAATRRR